MKRPRSSPIAVGLDGTVYMSVFELDGVETLEEAQALLEGESRVFVGVALTPAEWKRLSSGLLSAAREATAFVAGRRRWRR